MNLRFSAASLASIAVGAALMFGAPPLWWFGSGAIVAGAAVGAWAHRDRLREMAENLRRPREVWGVEFVPAVVMAEIVCLGILAAVTVEIIPEAAFGDRPVEHDHPVHFFKAWQLEHHFLAEGRLHGWSHRWFAGYPAQYLYPIGADLLVVAIHWLTFGLADLSQAYAWAVWMFWFLGGYACYRFASRLFGRPGGLLAGFLFLTDTAAFRMGGWVFGMKWGVWPMSLSVALAVLAMSRVPRLMTGERWRDVAVFAAITGASLVTHPFMLIHFAVALPAAALAFWLADSDVPWLVGTGRLVAGAAAGALLAMIWLLPFLASGESMDPMFGGRWTHLYELGSGFYGLDLFPGTWGFATALAVPGIVLMLVSRRFGTLLVGLTGIAFLFIGSGDFLAAFSLLEHLPRLQRVAFTRFVALLKPYWMIAAAYAAVCIVGFAARQTLPIWGDSGTVEEDRRPSLRNASRLWLQMFVVGFCLTPLAVPFGKTFGEEHLVRTLQNASERSDQQARDRLVRWFREHHGDETPFFRIAVDLPRHDHRLVDLGTRVPFPIYKVGFMPASSFEFRPEFGSRKAYDAFNIRYLVTKSEPPEGPFEKIKKFGPYSLFEYRDWSSEPFEILEGEGPVELKEFDSERIVLEAGEGAEGRLRLNVSNFSAWRAYRDGRPIPIEETSVGDDTKTGLMTVDLEPGRYRFEFEHGWSVSLAWLLFLVGLLLVVAFAAADLERESTARLRGVLEGFCERLARMSRTYDSVLQPAGIGFVVLGMGVLAWMGVRSPEIDVKGVSFAEQTQRVRYDFGHRLRDATVEAGEDPAETCDPLLGSFVCGTAPRKVVHHRVEDFGDDLSMARCIWAQPLPSGPIAVSFRGVPAGDAVVGYFGVPVSGTATESKPVVFRVELDGDEAYTGRATTNQKLYEFRVPVEPRATDGTVDVGFEVSAEETDNRHFCFNAQIVDLAQGASAGSSGDDSQR